MIESPPPAAMTIPTPGSLRSMAKIISTTISSTFPRIPAQTVALLKTLPLSMTAK